MKSLRTKVKIKDKFEVKYSSWFKPWKRRTNKKFAERSILKLFWEYFIWPIHDIYYWTAEMEHLRLAI